MRSGLPSAFKILVNSQPVGYNGGQERKRLAGSMGDESVSPNQKAINITRLYAETLKKKNLPVKSVILFGSQARGDYEPDSDIDVFVVTEKLDTKIREAILGEAFEISLNEDVVLIPVIYDLERFESPLFRAGPLYQNISQEGIVIL